VCVELFCLRSHYLFGSCHSVGRNTAVGSSFTEMGERRSSRPVTNRSFPHLPLCERILTLLVPLCDEGLR